MKEIQLLKPEDHQRLLGAVEKNTGLILPVNDDRFGALSFHLYFYEGHPALHFQMRWGVKKIFGKKNLSVQEENLTSHLCGLIKRHAATIRENLQTYCLEQLKNLMFLELDPHFTFNPGIGHQFTLKVCKARSKVPEQETCGWPNYCVAISWVDETDEFQEFLYPLRVDAEQRILVIPAEDIARRFKIYRDRMI